MYPTMPSHPPTHPQDHGPLDWGAADKPWARSAAVGVSVLSTPSRRLSAPRPGAAVRFEQLITASNEVRDKCQQKRPVEGS